jgi:putative aminopeptidase FrvX
MFRLIFLSGLISFVLIPCLLAAGLIFDQPVFWLFSLFPAFFLLTGILLLLQRELCGSYTAGANDNASAVAVLGGLAHYFAKNPADNCEIYFVGTGSEESGIIGMTHFLKNSRKQLFNPLFINLESLGCGQLKYIEREGMFPVLRADPYLRNLAERAAQNKDLPFVAGRFHTILTDNVSVLARRLPGLTLMGCGPDQLIPYWHQSGDILQNIREENLIQAVELVKEMVALIDTENIGTH